MRAPAAGMLTTVERTMPPIMSGAHGGVVPSAALQAESPKSGAGLVAGSQLVFHIARVALVAVDRVDVVEEHVRAAAGRRRSG